MQANYLIFGSTGARDRGAMARACHNGRIRGRLKMTMRRQTLFAATALATVLTTPAFAQADDGASTGDIIVTARRTEERLQDVPISITVYNQQQLDNRNVTTATELAIYTPSLASNNRFGPDKASFAIRGFSMIETTSPTVGVYFADVVSPRAAAGTASGNGAGPGSFFDLQNVQVLKGPQGTLFGRNTTGGNILLVPTKPTDQLEGYVEGSVGNYNLRRVQAVVNVPLSDTFRVRVGVDRQKRDGYLNNKSGIGPDDFGDSNYVAARLSIVGDLTPDLENYTVARYSRSDTNSAMFRMVGCNRSIVPFNPLNPTSPAGTRANVFAPAACNQIDRQNARGDGFYDVENTVPDPFNILEEWQIINTTTWRASDTLTIKNIASYGQFREQFHQSIGGENLFFTTGPNAGKAFPATTIRHLNGRYGAAQSTFTEELQFQGNSADSSLIWQAGAYFESSKPESGGNTTFSQGGLFCTDVTQLQCETIVPNGAGPSLGLIQNQIEFRNIGFYAQATYNLTEQFAVTGGVRYTIDRTVGRGGRVNVSFPTPNNPTGRCAHPDRSTVVTFNPLDCSVGDFEQKSEEPTWLIGLDFKPIPDVLLYAKYARGYRQGGVNPSNIRIETWGPEKVDSYEVGAKTSWRGPVPGFLNIAGFYNDLTDQQLNATATGCTISLCGFNAGLPGARVVINAGKSRIWGVEVDGSVSPFQGLKLDVGYAYLNTRLIESDPVERAPDSPFAAIIPPFAGNDLPLSPHHRLTATAAYTLPLDASIGDISFGGTYTYTSEQIVNETSPFGYLPGSHLLNLNVNWNSVLGAPVDAAFFMTNVTNEEFPVSVAGNWASGGYDSIVTNVPRMYGFRLKYRFGN
jgi:iron complex outermembrane recepter protein